MSFGSSLSRQRKYLKFKVADHMDTKTEPILVWGIAGASLGMEIAKCLSLGGYRNIIGCDISPMAFGHFSDVFHRKYVLDSTSPERSLHKLLQESKPRFVIAGGDQVSRVVTKYAHIFYENNCRICGNDDAVVQLSSDKYRVMVELQNAGFSVPHTRLIENESSLCDFPLPAVLKPRFDSGGSRGVFVVFTQSELESRTTFILANDIAYVAQEYISDAVGEYTIGVLSETTGRVAGSILLRRTFQNMLSVHERNNNFLISSGSSQGFFEHNETLQSQAEAMAAAVGSTGPLNIQARVKNGNLAIFEINPRFSASTYLRALSGVNEVDLFVQHLANGEAIAYPDWRNGLALRTFGEVFVEQGALPKDVL